MSRRHDQTYRQFLHLREGRAAPAVCEHECEPERRHEIVVSSQLPESVLNEENKTDDGE